MNSVVSNNQSLKYQGFTSAGCKDIGIRTLLSLWQKLNSFQFNLSRLYLRSSIKIQFYLSRLHLYSLIKIQFYLSRLHLYSSIQIQFYLSRLHLYSSIKIQFYLSRLHLYGSLKALLAYSSIFQVTFTFLDYMCMVCSIFYFLDYIFMGKALLDYIYTFLD